MDMAEKLWISFPARSGVRLGVRLGESGCELFVRILPPPNAKTKKKKKALGHVGRENNFLFATFKNNQNPFFPIPPTMDLSEKDREVERKKEQILKKLRRSLDLGEITPEGLSTAARKQKRRENKNSVDYVPRGPTGYNLYSDSVRASVAQKFEHRDVMGQIAIKWKALSQPERDAWVEKARKLKLRESSPGRGKSPRSSTKRSSKKNSKRTPKSKGSAKKSTKAKRNSGRVRKS